MKRFALAILTLMTLSPVFGFQRAFYIKKGDSYTKYNFGVASDLVFTNQGKNLIITGYGEVIDLESTDGIVFNAPVNNTALTPAAQKERMIHIGEAINDKIDLNKCTGLLQMIDAFGAHHDGQGDKTICPPIEFSVPEEYWNVHRKVGAMMEPLYNVFKGNFAAMRQAASAAVDLYKAEDYFGIYTANYQTRTWDKTGTADYLEIRFSNHNGTKMYSVRLDCSNDYTTWETGDFICQAPKKMTLTFACDGSVVGTAEIFTVLAQDQSVDMTVRAFSGGYDVKDVLKIVNNAITDNISVTVDGTYFMNADITVDGQGLTDYDVMKPAIGDSFHHHNENGECIDADPTDLFAHLFRAHANVDVLNQLQAKAKIFDFQKLYDRIDLYNQEMYYEDPVYGRSYEKVLDWNPGSGIFEVTYDDIDYTENLVNHLANYSDAQFFYDRNPAIQGFLTWEFNTESEDMTFDAGNGIDYQGGVIIKNNYAYNCYRFKETKPLENGEMMEYWTNWTVDGKYERVEVNENDVIVPTVKRTTYYEPLPILIFPDLTTYSFEDYFDKISFNKLIEDYDSIIDTYKKITGVRSE